jgi:glycosyltransferase involved in cell wall biosynthesis
MKICYLTTSFLPELDAESLRVYYFCKYLVKFNHEPFILTMRKVDVQAPWVKRCWGVSLPFIFPGSGYVPSLVFELYKVYKKAGIDVIHATTPVIGTVIAAYLSHKITGVPFIFEVRDPWIRPINTKDGAFIYDKSLKGSFFKKIMRDICSAASKIIVTNPEIKDEMKGIFHLEDEKFKVIYNGVDLEEIEKITPKKFGKFTILYAGRINKYKSLECVIDALRYVDAQLVICGSGDTISLRREAEEKEVSKKVWFTGLLSHDEILAYQLGADILYVGLTPRELLKYALPSKIFEYIGCGKPILAVSCKGGALDNFIKRHNCGISCSGDSKEIANAINLLAERKEMYGDKGKKAAQLYTREKLTKQLIDVYESVK